MLALRGDSLERRGDQTQRVYHADRYRLSITVARAEPSASPAQLEGTLIEGSIVDQTDPMAPLHGNVMLLHATDILQQAPLDEFGYFA